MDNNKVRFGISHAYYSVMTITNGVPTYATPVAFPGSVSLSLSAEGGDPTPFYADNITYYLSPGSNNGYSGDWEVALIPDQFAIDVLGAVLDDDGKLLEIGSAVSKNFALLFEFDGDQNKTRHVLYNCVAGRPDFGSSTIEDAAEPQTETLSITAIPQEFTKTVQGAEIKNTVVKAKVTAGDSTYDNWFSAVSIPNLSTEA